MQKMKSLLVIFVLVGLVAFAHCFPGGSRSGRDSDTDEKPNTQVELILPEQSRRNFEGFGFGSNDDDDDGIGTVRITPLSFQFRPFRFEFSPLYSYMRDWMKDLFNDVPSFDDFKPFGGKIPEGANTTSTTKVINGTVVTVNETTYTDNNENGGTFIRFRVIHVKPENETTRPGGYDGNTDVEGGEEVEVSTDNRPTESSTKEETTPERSVETVEDMDRNEIPRTNVDVLQA